MTNALCSEIASRRSYLPNQEISSIYFGGGTPSLLSVAELEQIMNTISKNFTLTKKNEITIEANPDDIQRESLKGWKNAGINRLSIGLQSFIDEELQWMNRAHTAAESTASVKLAQEMGFENITVDLIYGSKFQNEASWEETLLKTLELKVPHISAYNLTIEEKTVLGVKRKKNEEPAVSDELSEWQFIRMSEVLRENGFDHYEISNFAKEGYMALHNSNYWKRKPYLGIGPSAHSYNGEERQWNISNNELYIQKINSGLPYFELEQLSPANKYNEYILTGLRTCFGCDLRVMRELFGEEKTAAFEKNIRLQSQFIQEDKGVFTLNLKGKLYADKIASDLFLT